MTKLKNISHFKASLQLRTIFVLIFLYPYCPATTTTTVFNGLSVGPTLHRLEKDPDLISGNKPGLLDRIAAWFSRTVCCQLSMFIFASQAEPGKRKPLEVCLMTQLKTKLVINIVFKQLC